MENGFLCEDLMDFEDPLKIERNSKIQRLNKNYWIEFDNMYFLKMVDLNE